MAEEFRPTPGSTTKSSPGPYLAKIVSHLDPTYMGTLEVQLLHEVGNDDSLSGQLHQVKYLSPFAGQTSVEFVGEEDDYNNTQKSYGFWMIPPDVGSVVMVIFVDGDPRKGYWIGCVQDKSMNFSMPGNAATSFNTDGIEERVPVAEYNKITQASTVDPTSIPKPASPLQQILIDQGLILDDIRGITTSSARREIPSSVFGISTPGPVDKRSGAKQGKIGKAEHKIASGFVSRLGGSSFVMDDGDDKFLRRTTASEGPPDYAAVEQDETDGLPEIPHNELIRLRTRTGHQILLHNSEDLIYIGNSRGTAWIELTSDGKIDIYAEDSISIHTGTDLNIRADRDINLEAGRNVNIKASADYSTGDSADSNGFESGRVHIESQYDTKILVGGNGYITTATNLNISTGFNNNLTAGAVTNILSGGDHVETAATINMNGKAAESAESAGVLPVHENIVTDSSEAWENKNRYSVDTPLKSIMKRVPMHEPWALHENQAPAQLTPENTDREA